MKFRDRALLKMFGLLTLAVLTFSCATTSAIYQACKPPKTDETQAITDLFSRPDLTTAEVIAAAEAGKIAICVVTEIAKDILAQANSTHAASTFMSMPSPMVTRAEEWIKAHP